jgi:hypothetical protein
MVPTLSLPTDITNHNKQIFLWTRLHPEIRAAVHKSNDHLNFDTCLKAEVKVMITLCLNAEYNKAFKSAPEE